MKNENVLRHNATRVMLEQTGIITEGIKTRVIFCSLILENAQTNHSRFYVCK